MKVREGNGISEVEKGPAVHEVKEQGDVSESEVVKIIFVKCKLFKFHFFPVDYIAIMTTVLNDLFLFLKKTFGTSKYETNSVIVESRTKF